MKNMREALAQIGIKQERKMNYFVLDGTFNMEQMLKEIRPLRSMDKTIIEGMGDKNSYLSGYTFKSFYIIKKICKQLKVCPKVVVMEVENENNQCYR